MPLKGNRLSYECACGHTGYIVVDRTKEIDLTSLREQIEFKHGENSGALKVLLAIELEHNLAPWVTCAVRHIQ